MLESIIALGDMVLGERDKLISLIKKVPYEKKGKPQHVCKFIFNTEKGEFKVDVNEEIDASSAYKYLHIGRIGSSRSPQWQVTSTTSNYILSEFFPNIYELGILKEKADYIVENFYYEFPREEVGDKKYQYMLDISKLGITDKDMEDIWEEVKNESKPGKKLLDKIQKELNNWLKNTYGITSKEIGLYTVIIDDIPVSDYPEYREKVIEAKFPQVIQENKTNYDLECNICGSRENISSDLNKMQIKYFTTNQEIFKGNLEDYRKSLNLCRDCIEKMQAGENFLKQNMKTQIGGFDVLVIPDLIYGEGLNAGRMEELSKNIVGTINGAKSLKELGEFKKLIDQMKDFDDIYYLLDFVFIREANASTKILRLIKDVHPSFFEKMSRAVGDLQKKAEDYFKGIYRYNGGLEQVYYSIPIRFSDKKSENATFRDILALYDALFTGRQVDKKHIIENLNTCFAVVFYERKGFNVSGAKKENLHYKILDGVFFVKFLEYMGCMKGGERVDYSRLDLKEEVKNFMQDMGYNEMQGAMFLLGYLVGEVGNAQAKRLKESGGEGNYKPVLNKINFNGIDTSKLMKLRSEIFNKMRQEKILHYNERVFAVLSQLMDKNLPNWKLSKDENLFYLLSGYAYATTAPIKKTKEEGNNGQQPDALPL